MNRLIHGYPSEGNLALYFLVLQKRTEVMKLLADDTYDR